MDSPRPSYTTPRPVPLFYDVDRPIFSTKKQRCSPGNYQPNRPAAKSAPPISRIFPHRLMSQKAQPISFKSHSESSLSKSKHYNESDRALYFDQVFTIEAKLGEGSFGEVFKVKSKEDGMLYAIKRGREKFRNASDRLAKLSEVQKHETLPKHTNVVEFIKAWEERGCLYIQTELCQISLSDYAEKNHNIPEATVWNYFVDLLLAVKHLHDHELIHLDIKPENIFISRNGICKLGDFGLVYDLNRVGISDAQEGDAKYLAPEILNDVIGKSNDIFSLGVTLMELACDLDLPSHGESWQLIRQGRLPDEMIQRLSPELQRLIRLMLHPDHKTRPSVDQLLRLPSVQKVLRRRRFAFYYSHVADTLRGIFAVMWLYASLLLTTIFGRTLEYFKSRRNSNGFDHNGMSRSQQSYQKCRFVDPVAKPLNFDHSFSDEEEADELSSIHDCSIQTRTEGPQSHNCSGSFPDHNSFVSPLRTEYPAVKCRPPWNSTPAQKPTQRRAVLFESPMTTRSSTPSDPQQHHNSCLLERRFVPYSPTNAIGFDTTLAFSVVSRQSHSALVSSSPSVLNSSLPVSFHSALQNSSRQSVRSDQSITDGKSQRPILPKNLLDAFEGTSSDDE